MKNNSVSPLITVVTVVFNDEDNIASTIESVISQDFAAYEYIIIDGGSTDGTLDIIKGYGKTIDLIISEPDSGIYEAMNKGIDNSTAKWIIFINSGDRFIDDHCLSMLANHCNNDLDIIYGNVVLVDAMGNETIQKHSPFTRFNLFKKTICHQAIIFNRDVFNELGTFNINYKIKADYEWLVKYYFTKGRRRVLQTHELVSRYLIGGFSSNTYTDVSEKLKIIEQYFSFLEYILFKCKTGISSLKTSITRGL